MTATGLVASRRVYAGLLLVTLATVMYEIVLTRIFSVTMWYHFAFVAISVAMFGMTVGALVVYLRPDRFPTGQLSRRLGTSALLFGLSVVGSFLTHLAVPFTVDASVVALWSVLLTYVAIAVPFVFSGICVCLVLTRFPRQLARLYATDLVGAAAGCLLVILVIDRTDGPTTVVAIGALAALAGACFLGPADGQRLRLATLGVATVLALFVAANTVLIARQQPLIRLRWVKGAPERTPLYEKWNSFSRLTVHGDPRRPTPPEGWGLSSTYPEDRGVPQLVLLMDATAGSWLTAFDGRAESIEHLRYDVINLPHYLRRDARVLVIGTGGGRDVLSALLFRQRSVVGVEINGDIIELVNGRFGAFTGHLDRFPGVTFVNDEARSYMARQRERFDIVQISLIDTWAATGAGAFVLSEHSLYTTEAWRLFLDRLTPRGVLAVSRFYVGERPDEAYRLVSLAASALAARGVRNPREHILMVRHVGHRTGGVWRAGVATILVSPEPFSAEDLDVVDRVSRRFQFPVVLSPREAVDETFAAIASGRDVSALYAAFPVNIAAPTDDRPFFFHTLRLRDLARGAWRGYDPAGHAINTNAVLVLSMLFVTVLILTTLCVVVPLGLTADRAVLTGSGPLFVFFAAIGLGFMLVEISQMQRLIIFLGHPTYGLSVVLFAMLLSSGLGSLVSGALAGAGRRAVAPLAALVGVLALFGVATPVAIGAFAAATTPARIAVAVLILFPIGLLMGTAFPLGMRLAAAGAPALTPWLWGVNGATSVCASVLAVVIALNAGISASFWTGVACYVLAALAFRAALRLTLALPPAGG
jgi:hypothetical protein